MASSCGTARLTTNGAGKGANLNRFPSALGSAGVVDQNVDLAELAVNLSKHVKWYGSLTAAADLFDHFIHLRLVRDVASHDHRAASHGTDLLCHCLCIGTIALQRMIDGNVCALLCESQRNCPSNPG